MIKNIKKIFEIMLVLSVLLISTISVSANSEIKENKNNKKIFTAEIQSYNIAKTGKVYGYLTWGSEHPDDKEKGDPIPDCYVECTCIRFIFSKWRGEDTTDENGYFEIDGIPIGETFLNGDPWRFSIDASVFIQEGIIKYHYRGFSSYFTMGEDDEHTVQKNIKINWVGITSYPLHRFSKLQQINNIIKRNLPNFNIYHTKFIQELLSDKFS